MAGMTLLLVRESAHEYKFAAEWNALRQKRTEDCFPSGAPIAEILFFA